MSTVPSSSSNSPRPPRWPSVSDYNEAVQNLHVSMADAELRGGTAVPGITGLPMPYAGGFADVYKVECPATGNTWAVKFFKREIRGLRDRYREISQYLAQARLPFMVEFHYLDEGVRIAGRWYPIVKLRWVEGLNLNEFVVQSLEQPRMFEQLLGFWVKLASRLRGAGLAHADLQHGNVMLVPRGDQGNLVLKLIDYDGMWVPGLAGRPSGEVGHRHFQHPQRAAANVFSAEVDRFSHLAICCALRCLSIGGRSLWERFDNGDNLLFQEQDFANPAESPLFRELWTLRQPPLRALVGHLALATRRPLEQTPLVEELIKGSETRPLTPAERDEVDSILSGKKDPRGTGSAPKVVDVPPVIERDARSSESVPIVVPPAAPTSSVPVAQGKPATAGNWNIGKRLSSLWSGGNRDRAWGVEVGQCGVKALCCQRQETGAVVPIGYDYLEYPKILSQPDADPEQLIREALAQFASRNVVQNTPFAISVPAPSALARFFKLPPVEEKKIADIVKFEAKSQIPFPLDEVVWDYQIMSGERVDGFALETEIGLFAMKRDMIERAMLPWQQFGIHPDIVQITSVALYNLVASDLLSDGRRDIYEPEAPPPSWLVIAIGADHSDLVVTDGVKVWFRNVSLGGNHFTRALTKDFKLTFAKAEHLKRNVVKSPDPKAVFQALRPVFNDFVVEIQRSIGYFSAIHRKAKIQRIILLGNGSKLPGLGTYLSKHLQYEVAELPGLQALTRSGVTQSPVFQDNVATFGVAYGLCRQALGPTEFRTSLAPRERRGVLGRLFGKGR